MKNNISAETFASELMQMQEDERILFSILYSMKSVDMEYLREYYNIMIKDLSIASARPFDEITSQLFEDQKLGTGEGVDCTVLEFASKAQENALPLLLKRDAGFEHIFLHCLAIMARESDTVKNHVAASILPEYNLLTPDVQSRFLDVISDTTCCTISFISAIFGHYTTLPENVQNILVRLLGTCKGYEAYVAMYIIEQYNTLPEEIHDLLQTTVERCEFEDHDEFAPATTTQIVGALIKHYNALPESVHDLLDTLAQKDEETEKSIAWPVAENYDRLPREIHYLLVTLVKKYNDEARRVAVHLLENFEKISPDLQILLPEIIKIAIISKPKPQNRIRVIITPSNEQIASLIKEHQAFLPKEVRDMLPRILKGTREPKI